eukprot:6124200-Amphidinium_carterae.1
MESESDQTEIKIKQCKSYCKSHVKHTDFNMVAEQCHLQSQRCHAGVTRVKQADGIQTNHQKSTTTTDNSQSVAI